MVYSFCAKLYRYQILHRPQPYALDRQVLLDFWRALHNNDVRGDTRHRGPNAASIALITHPRPFVRMIHERSHVQPRPSAQLWADLVIICFIKRALSYYYSGICICMRHGRPVSDWRPRSAISNTEAFNMATASPPHGISGVEPGYYGTDVLLEEESFSCHNPEAFYQVRMGEMLQSRYQVLVKLGYGSVSTAWLCRDLQYGATPSKLSGQLR